MRHLLTLILLSIAGITLGQDTPRFYEALTTSGFARNEALAIQRAGITKFQQLDFLDLKNLNLNRRTRERLVALNVIRKRYPEPILIGQLIDRSIQSDEDLEQPAIQRIVADFYNSDAEARERLEYEAIIRSRAGINQQSNITGFGAEILLDENAAPGDPCIPCEKDKSMISPGVYFLYLVDFTTQTLTAADFEDLSAISRRFHTEYVDIPLLSDSIYTQSYVELTNEVLEHYIAGPNPSDWANTKRNKNQRARLKDQIYQRFQTENVPEPRVLVEYFDQLVAAFNTSRYEVDIIDLGGPEVVAQFLVARDMEATTFAAINVPDDQITMVKVENLKTMLLEREKRAAGEIFRREKTSDLTDEFASEFVTHFRALVEQRARLILQDTLSAWASSQGSIRPQTFEAVLASLSAEARRCILLGEDCPQRANTDNLPLNPIFELYLKYGEFLGSNANSVARDSVQAIVDRWWEEARQVAGGVIPEADSLLILKGFTERFLSDELLEQELVKVTAAYFEQEVRGSDEYLFLVAQRAQEVFEQKVAAFDKGVHTKIRRNLLYLIDLDDNRLDFSIPSHRAQFADFLFLDLTVDESYQTTPFAFGIQRLHTLLQRAQLGIAHERISPESYYQIDEFDEKTWRWLKSYGSWDAAQNVSYYPENYLLYSIRKDKTPEFDTLIINLESNMPIAAALKLYQDSIRDALRFGADPNNPYLTSECIEYFLPDLLQFPPFWDPLGPGPLDPWIYPVGPGSDPLMNIYFGDAATPVLPSEVGTGIDLTPDRGRFFQEAVASLSTGTLGTPFLEVQGLDPGWLDGIPAQNVLVLEGAGNFSHHFTAFDLSDENNPVFIGGYNQIGFAPGGANTPNAIRSFTTPPPNSTPSPGFAVDVPFTDDRYLSPGYFEDIIEGAQLIPGCSTAPVYNEKYFREKYLFVPLLVAEMHNRNGDFEEAFTVLNSLYNPLLAPALRIQSPLLKYVEVESQILGTEVNNHYGFQLGKWLEDPFNPFLICDLNYNLYIKHIKLFQVRNMLDWADQLFATDNPESVNRARELYELAADILQLVRFPEAGCAELLYNLGEISYDEELLLDEVLELFGAKGCRLNGDLTGQIESIMVQSVPLRDKREQLYALLNDCAGTVADAELGDFTLAAGGNPTANSTADVFILDEVDRAYIDDSISVSGEVALQVPKPFCLTRNPLIDIYKDRIESNLDKIRTNRNFAGFERSMTYYTSAIDPNAVLEQIANNGEYDFDSFTFDQSAPPPIYRYQPLRERALALTQSAQKFEAAMLSAQEKLDQVSYSLMRARQDAGIEQQNYYLQGLRLREANTSKLLSREQVNRGNSRLNHYSELVDNGLLDKEIEYLDKMKEVASKNKSRKLANEIFGAVKFGVGIIMAVKGNPAGGGQLAAQGLEQFTNSYYDPSAISTEAAIASTEASFERRKQEWKFQQQLAAFDVKIAEIGVTLAEDRIDIVEKEQDIARRRWANANQAITFLETKFTDTDLYRWMSSELKRQYREQLGRAAATAKAAQQALEFERQTSLGYIGGNYWNEEKRGLLGAERLENDIEALEQYRLNSNSRKKEIRKVISLASYVPEAFQEFTQTGELFFETPKAWFDRDFPGHYRRAIQSIEVTVVALTNGQGGINATLSNNGISRMVTDPRSGAQEMVYRLPESIALSQASNDNGLFVLVPDDPLLYPFEGSGVATNWTLSMPKGANPIDYSTIVDVFVTINYTALEDAGLRTQVLEAMGQDESGYVKNSSNRFFSLRDEFPDAWYYFKNPVLSQGNPTIDPTLEIYGDADTTFLKEGSMVIDIEDYDFLPNEEQQKITKVTVVPVLSDEVELIQDTDQIRIAVAHVPGGATNNPIPADQRTELNVQSFYDSTNNFNGESPLGYWAFQLNMDRSSYTHRNSNLSDAINDSFDLSKLEDLIFIVEYEAKVHYPR